MRTHRASILFLTALALAAGPAAFVTARSDAPLASSGHVEQGPTMVSSRASHTATRLEDGSVLIIGGWGNQGLAERWDPTTETFDEAGSIGEARWYHTATLHDDGSVAVIGGGQDSSLPWVLTWTDGAFSAAGELRIDRAIHTATLLDDGSVLVTGGYGGDARASAERWDPGTGSASAAGELADGRAWHTATRLSDGRVLVVGGSPNAELWDPATGSFSPAGSLPEPRSWPTATLLDDDRVLIVGGGVGETVPGTGDVLSTALLWDPVTLTFGPAGTMATPRTVHTATLLPDGRVLIVGGGEAPREPPVEPIEVWDPETMTFSPAGSLSTGRYAPTATLLPDGRVLVAGGDVGGTAMASTELWIPDEPAGS